jgi:hypothetical protein
MGLFTGQPWYEKEDGTFQKDGGVDGAGHIMQSAETQSNGKRDNNHAHGFPDGTFSYKVDGTNSGGTAEVVSTSIFTVLFEGSGDDYTTTRPS